MHTTTIEFDDIFDDRYGGKALGLAELTRLGLSVPTGFVIGQASPGPLPDAVTERFTQLRAPVAVRSSATGEDGVEQSFAGQYDTVLGVDSLEGFTAAVRRCVDSVGSERASSYGSHDGDPGAVAMNVVVQRMVDARAAGVVFTADPTSGRRDLLVIDAIAGLGEALVDGSASSDHLVLDTEGTQVVREVGEVPVLSDAEVANIRAGALDASKHWCRPMDLEWAIDGTGQLWWLQARPITTLPGDLDEMDTPVAGAAHVYTRCNIGEAGADDVESAMMVGELHAVVREIAADDAADQFLASAPADALNRLRSSDGPGGVALQQFLSRHGHRGYRELCMRDPAWAEDAEGLGSMMQVMVQSTREAVGDGPTRDTVAEPTSRTVRLLARLAQGGARGREETKSKMALMAHRLKLGYRHLGEVLADSGHLPDPDLVFFFDRSELPRVVADIADPDEVTDLVQRAIKRRDALAFQQSLEFDDVSVGRPAPTLARTPGSTADDQIVGRPASWGIVEGTVRVAKSIHDAREVRRGEILVAPVTDVGWTPYFTVIAALVTDIGSSVSHGAVVAREYGLPCVVNTLVATQVLKTGDRVRVDGDRGVITRLESS